MVCLFFVHPAELFRFGMLWTWTKYSYPGMFGTVRVRLVVSITVIWLPNELRFARKNECVWMGVVFAPLVFDDACNEPQASSLVYRHSRIVYDYDLSRCRGKR